jgi:hypothetical protein
MVTLVAFVMLTIDIMITFVTMVALLAVAAIVAFVVMVIMYTLADMPYETQTSGLGWVR